MSTSKSEEVTRGAAKGGVGGKTRESAEQPQSVELSRRGVKTAGEFADVMSALMTDILAGDVPPHVGNAACNAGAKLLRAIDLAYRYGQLSGKGRTPKLKIVG